MRPIQFLLLSFLIFSSGKLLAQTKTYEAAWKKVDELVDKKTLPKSALAEVKKIYALAKKENNEVQVIKSLVYMTDLQEELREDNDIQSIKDVEKEITTAKEPALSILQSMLANLYWDYFQNNRYNLYDRTNTANFNKADIKTWTIADFHKKISGLFLQSVKNEQLLKQTKLEPFDEIIIKGNLRYLRPTLYDLLAHKALDYFKNDERDIERPAYAFEIDQKEAFAPAAEFVKYRFITKDSFSLQQKALLVYQDLTSFHLNDSKSDALIDLEIERIEFVHDNATMENKDELYKTSLENLISKYPSNAIAKKASYLLATYYNNLASDYDPHKDTIHRYDKIKAKEILERAVKDSSVKTEGWIGSYNLLKQITEKSFSFSLEKVNLPNQPFRALVNYNNITNLNFRLINATDVLKTGRTYDDEEKFWNALIKAASIRSWSQSLPATNDYQNHSVEIKIDGLAIGEYILLASYDGKFERKNNPLARQVFYVSNISYINNQDEFFVLHRETGQPLPNAAVQVWQQYYDSKTSSYKKEKSALYKTDDNGYFKFVEKKKENYYYYYLDITYNNDHLFLGDALERIYPDYQQNSDTVTETEFEKQRDFTYLFTDRSIYRPGQTIYFKGISVTKTKENKNKVQSNFKNTIYLRDANYQVIDSMILTTNEYGSFSGKFQLPLNILTGQFTLHMKDFHGQEPIRIEEYKRPKFYVEFEKVKDTYKVNDSVKLTGYAKAYAGNNIDEAKVSYRVVRQARFIYDWIRWWRPQTEMEIAHGEVTTDSSGKFSIHFAAIPDRSIDKASAPVFDYHVYADVTDINGETRSNENIISAGYQSLLLKTVVGERISIDSFKTIFIRTENMNGAYQPSTVSVSVFKLVPEKRLVRERLWERPDQYVMSKEEFITFFPHDEYATETDFKTWPREKQVYAKTDSTRTSGEWPIANNQLTNGFYAIEMATKDKDGQEVKDIKYVELFDPKASQLNKPEYLWTKASEKPIEPGEKTNIQIGSSTNVYLIKRKDQPSAKNVVDYSVERLSSEKKTFEYTATEADRGGYGINFFFVKDNRFYHFNDVISVPWSNKDLKIEFATFRDKTLPGSQEKWKVKISGYKNEKVAAEMLASMYDVSLDQFYFHQWNIPGLWSDYVNRIYWNEDNFRSVASSQKSVSEYDEIYSRWSYDELGFDVEELLNEHTKRKLIKEGKWKDVRYYTLGGRVAGLFSSGNYMMAPMDFDAGASLKFSANYVAPLTDKARYKGEDIAGSISADTVAFNQKLGDLSPEDFEKMKNLTNEGLQVQPRKNFNETAFFFPDLRTDENGTIEFSFNAPEALTKWKLQTLAHTKELAFGFSQKELLTQKQLMVQPNMPRFLRQGDHIELVAKIVNLSDSELTGQAQLELFDATTNQPVDGWFLNTFPNQYFTVGAGQSEVVKFPVQVPMQFNNAIVWRITARSGNNSDAEEDALPVLSNRVLVTETLAIHMNGAGTKNLSFEKLLQSGSSESLQHQSLTIEYTSNPAWYALQSLPYLMEFPYECAEQTWNRYYANSLASRIANSSPRIKQIFDQWKTLDTAALVSNLQKNQELKSALLEETPWVLEAKSEEQQKKNIALLFDAVKMNSELRSNLNKLKEVLNSNGSFSWFKGGYEDRYITQYILTGIAHLRKLNAIVKDEEKDINSIANNALMFLDKKIKEDYDYLIRHKANLAKEQIDEIQIQYLYMRSFFSKTLVPQSSQVAYSFYKKQASQFWKNENKCMQAMIALVLFRNGDVESSKSILKSLKESSITDDELGMYWKDNRFGYSWHWSYAPIETQALMIEAFNEITKDDKSVDDLKTWLIKNKQTNSWPTTKATAEACYAMLLQGTDWLNSEPVVQIKLGSTMVSNDDTKTEAGTGYFKRGIKSDQIQPEMGTISATINQPVNNSTSQPLHSSWGSIYWQYFEDMDKITTASTPLQLSKKLFIEKNSDRGPVLTPVEEGMELHVGDKIKVRIELRVDRDMDYVHMKDMRASALEPVNVLSGYKWQGGLGYYESTKDASTNFFFDHLQKGTYVFEYPLFITHTGSFSNGITTIQCMYAPEFSAHSEGIKITVE